MGRRNVKKKKKKKQETSRKMKKRTKTAVQQCINKTKSGPTDEACTRTARCATGSNEC